MVDFLKVAMIVIGSAIWIATTFVAILGLVQGLVKGNQRLLKTVMFALVFSTATLVIVLGAAVGSMGNRYKVMEALMFFSSAAVSVVGPMLISRMFSQWKDVN